jgi:hypothetical protein
MCSTPLAGLPGFHYNTFTLVNIPYLMEETHDSIVLPHDGLALQESKVQTLPPPHMAPPQNVPSLPSNTQAQVGQPFRAVLFYNLED